MKLSKNIKFLLLFFAVQAVSYVQADDECCPAQEECDNIGKNLWMPRPLSSYATSDLVTIRDLHTEKDWDYAFGVTTEYMSSFGKSEAKLGSLPFWSGTNTMTIGNNDGEHDLDAYQFGLGDVETPGSITLTPKIKHTGANFVWHVLQRPIHETGMYFQIKAPLGSLIVDNQLCEDLAVLKNKPDLKWIRYTAVDARFKSITEALYGGFNEKEPDYQFGRIFSGKKSTIRLGDLEFALGYNFLAREKGYLGAGFKLSCPTGNVPDAHFMLEPLFGRAAHWGVGGEIRGNYLVWDGDDYQVNLHGKGEVLHLFANRRPSWRSFDLKQNGKGSKYLLVELYLPSDAAGVAPAGSAGITPAINITTLPVFSTIAIEGSASLMVDVIKDDWNFALTGEFWGRSKECLKIDCAQVLEQRTFSENGEGLSNYAVLGRQIDRNNTLTGTARNLYLCEPLARINQSENRVCELTEDYDKAKIKDARQVENRIPSSFEDALDIPGAAARQVYTGRITGTLGYTIRESSHEPHLAIIGGAEFTGSSNKMVNMWSVGLHGSVKL